MESRYVFAPGCALMLYKENLAHKIHDYLNLSMGHMDLHLTCCRHEPSDEEKLKIINVCPGCDKRFGNNYPRTSTISLWELIAGRDDFDYPDYNGKKMALLDACPARENPAIHKSVRVLLKKMNIEAVEPKGTKEKSICCGDSFYGVISSDKVKLQMIKRASEMPAEDVAVYCVSCTKSMFIGGKTPHYLVDLLFGEKTARQTIDPDLWHRELDEYIAIH